MSVNHYENFPVASLLCPPALRPAVRALYAYARTADDLADEGDAMPEQRLLALDAYCADLDAIASDSAPSARWRNVFEPLRGVLRSHALPIEWLAALLSAFQQDVVKHDYADRAELLDYCSRSANPVGRLMLHLYGLDRADALRQSDDICTALQLTNFWQDFGIDTRRGRLYVPLSDLPRHGLDRHTLTADAETPGAKALFTDLIGWTRAMMQRGAPLALALPGRAGWELRLVVQGGLRILDKLDALPGSPLHRRPVVGSLDAPALLWRALAMRAAPGVVVGRPT